tara:strand:+ start:50620 stop:51441 length:822 start_codon:yes stop_codon:yes gene_type:complete
MMEIREFAERIFFSDTLEGKLDNPAGEVNPQTRVPELSDLSPGEAIAWQQPARAPGIRVAPKKKRKKVPHPDALHQKEMRIRCLHAFANHELMALEMMAWALLAYPDAPKLFRKGLVRIILDEQLHLQMYMDQIAALGAKFGDLPLNDHFWRVAAELHNPVEWVCGMHLTFEQANLDHAPYFKAAFERVGDEGSAALMQRIFEDEIMHVRFGGRWLKHFTPEDMKTFDMYLASLSPHNQAFRAKGHDFNADARRDAGLDEDFIIRLHEYSNQM